MHALELKIPPVLVVLMVGAGMYAITVFAPALDMLLPGRRLIATFLALGGVAIVLLGVASFRRAGTTVDPMAPQAASSLVSRGIYRVSRNPMYLGFLLALSGWAVYLGNVAAFAGLPAFVLYMDRFQITPEERILANLFGSEFTAYRTSVRRWL